MGHLHGGCESSMFRIQGHEFPEPIPLLSPIPRYNQASDFSILQQFLLNSKAVKENIPHTVPFILLWNQKVEKIFGERESFVCMLNWVSCECGISLWEEYSSRVFIKFWSSILVTDFLVRAFYRPSLEFIPIGNIIREHSQEQHKWEKR